MGVPLNSSADDFGIVFHSSGKKGFFSSNRNSFDLNDDIFEFYINPPKALQYQVLVKDSITGTMLASKLIIIDTATEGSFEMNESTGDFAADLVPKGQGEVPHPACCR
jgi:hypothetical protein